MTYIYNGQEMTAREIKALNTNVSYTEPTQLGAVPVLPTPKPEGTELQNAVRDGVEVDAEGNTIQKWKLVSKFTEYTNEEGVVVTQDEQEAEYLAKLLADAKEAKRTEIKQAFQSASVDSITDNNGVTWKGGYDSATALGLKVYKEEQKGSNEVTFFDADSQPHTMTMQEAKDVAFLVSDKYEADLAKKNMLLNEINSKVFGTDTIEDIQAIAW